MNCNTLQHTATHCNTLQHTAICCGTLKTQCQTFATYTATYCHTLPRSHTLTCSHKCSALHLTSTHCSTLQHTATHCNTPAPSLVASAAAWSKRARHVQHTCVAICCSMCCSVLWCVAVCVAVPRDSHVTPVRRFRASTLHCNTLQHTATHLHHIATHCNTLQHTATHCNTFALHCNTFAPPCNTLQHTATHVHHIATHLHIHTSRQWCGASTRRAQHTCVASCCSTLQYVL